MSFWSRCKKLYWIWMAIFLLMVVLSGSLHLFSRDYGGAWIQRNEKSDLVQLGKSLYTQHRCADCHGSSGNEPILGEYPKVRGQNKKYTLQQLRDLKSGSRSNGMSGLMRAKLTELNDDQLEALAEFLEAK